MMQVQSGLLRLETRQDMQRVVAWRPGSCKKLGAGDRENLAPLSQIRFFAATPPTSFSIATTVGAQGPTGDCVHAPTHTTRSFILPFSEHEQLVQVRLRFSDLQRDAGN